MNTRCKFQYKSGLYFLNFPSNVSQETIFTDGFESMSTWDKTNNSFGHSLTALDTTKKKSGRYSGRIDDNYPANWEKYVYSDTWTPINNSQDTYYTVSGWVYVEDVTTNGSLPNLAKLWIVTRKQGERGYPTGHISTSSTKEGTWEYLSKTVLIPADVKEINVRIENARLGKVWFDDVKIVKGNTSQTVIVEESNYYPFGLKHKGYNNVVSSNGNSTAQKFGFGGKELNEELGLQWHDFDARNYDASLGRWMNIDPLADSFYDWSPYNFVYNNPLKFVDPTGMGPEWIDNGNGTYTAEEGDSASTLHTQHLEGQGFSFEQVDEIVQEQYSKNRVESGIEKSNVDPGDVVSAGKKRGGLFIAPNGAKDSNRSPIVDQSKRTLKLVHTKDSKKIALMFYALLKIVDVKPSSSIKRSTRTKPSASKKTTTTSTKPKPTKTTKKKPKPKKARNTNIIKQIKRKKKRKNNHQN